MPFVHRRASRILLVPVLLLLALAWGPAVFPVRASAEQSGQSQAGAKKATSEFDKGNFNLASRLYLEAWQQNLGFGVIERAGVQGRRFGVAAVDLGGGDGDNGEFGGAGPGWWMRR